MWRFQQKLKILTFTLSRWSKEVVGDMYANVKIHEEKVKVAEEKLILNGTDKNIKEFHKTQAEYIRHLKVKDAILRQKLSCIGLNMVMEIQDTSMPLLEKEEEGCSCTKSRMKRGFGSKGMMT